MRNGLFKGMAVATIAAASFFGVLSAEASAHKPQQDCNNRQYSKRDFRDKPSFRRLECKHRHHHDKHCYKDRESKKDSGFRGQFVLVWVD